MGWNEREERLLKFALVGVLLLVLVGIHIIDMDFYPTVWQLAHSGDMEGTVQFLASYGVWAMAVSFFIDVLINIIGFLPSIFLSAANGLVFGIGWGIVISWLGETVGVVISFWLMRSVFREMAKQAIEHHDMLSRIDQYSTWQTMAIARAIPYMPNGLITALGALSRIRNRDYIIGCLIGKLPSVALEVVVGHDVVQAEENALRLTLIVVGVTIIYGGLWWYMKKRK